MGLLIQRIVKGRAVSANQIAGNVKVTLKLN